jgi:hypothetical protein
MAKFRLKKEARPFFKEKLSTSIHDWDTWNSLNVDQSALEKVEECFVTYGHERESENLRSSSLSGWSNEKGSRFHFTMNFPSIQFREHDEFSKGRIVAEMMDRIQREINRFYEQFNNQETD